MPDSKMIPDGKTYTLQAKGKKFLELSELYSLFFKANGRKKVQVNVGDKLVKLNQTVAQLKRSALGSHNADDPFHYAEWPETPSREPWLKRFNVSHRTHINKDKKAVVYGVKRAVVDPAGSLTLHVDSSPKPLGTITKKVNYETLPEPVVTGHGNGKKQTATKIAKAKSKLVSTDAKSQSKPEPSVIKTPAAPKAPGLVYVPRVTRSIRF